MLYGIVSGNSKSNVQLSEISKNLKTSSEIYELSDKEVYLGATSHQTLVLFATEFANYALQNYAKKNYAKKDLSKAETCIRLTRKWLEDRESVSNEELKSASFAAHAAAHIPDNPLYAIYAAAYAAHAACVANAAYAANAAHGAADYAADAAGENKNQEYERQGTFILDFLKSGRQLFNI